MLKGTKSNILCDKLQTNSTIKQDAKHPEWLWFGQTNGQRSACPTTYFSCGLFSTLLSIPNHVINKKCKSIVWKGYFIHVNIKTIVRRALYFAGHCGGTTLASEHGLLTSSWSSKKTASWSSKRTSPWSSNKTSSRSSERRMILMTLLAVSSGGVGHLVLMDLLKTLTLTLWKLYYHEFEYYTTKLSSLTTLLMRIIKWWDPERKQAFYANVEQWFWNKKSALTITEWSLNGLTSVSHSLCCKIWVNSSKILVPIWLITDNADSLYIFNWSLLSDTHIVKLVQKYWFQPRIWSI